jgi:phage-related protein
MQKIIFHWKAREAIRNFPEDVRYELGRALTLLQAGLTLGMPLSRPMPAIGRNVFELRLRGQAGSFRVCYAIGRAAGILVFHAFVKKTGKTPPLELQLAARRLRDIENA